MLCLILFKIKLKLNVCCDDTGMDLRNLQLILTTSRNVAQATASSNGNKSAGLKSGKCKTHQKVKDDKVAKACSSSSDSGPLSPPMDTKFSPSSKCHMDLSSLLAELAGTQEALQASYRLQHSLQAHICNQTAEIKKLKFEMAIVYSLKMELEALQAEFFVSESVRQYTAKILDLTQQANAAEIAISEMSKHLSAAATSIIQMEKESVVVKAMFAKMCGEISDKNKVQRKEAGDSDCQINEMSMMCNCLPVSTRGIKSKSY